MTTSAPKDPVSRFIGYFRAQLTEIAALQTEHAELYRRLLYASVLDTLSGVVMPIRSHHGDRFVSFVQRFCKWPEGDRVSLPHLVQLLRRNPDPAFGTLREWAVEKFKKLPVHGSALMPITADPPFDEVRERWPTAKEHKAPLDGISVESLQHFKLLYAHRNSLVHELRVPGYGIEFGDDEDPFYHRMTHLNPDGTAGSVSIELVYPQRFLHRLCDTALNTLEAYYRANDLNPYEARAFGTYWIRELNR